MSSDNTEHSISPESEHTLEQKYQWSIGWRLPAMLFGPILLVLAIAIGHDQYLISLHSTLIGSHNTQLMIKGANNELATLSSLLLGISVTAGLTEITWDLIRRSRLTIEHLDAMFQLPSPLAFLAAPSVVRRANYLVLIFMGYYSLNLVSVFAPGSLSVRPEIFVWFPRINLLSSAYAFVTRNYTYSGPLPSFTRHISQSISMTGISTVDPPQECGNQCSYSFPFYTPSIACYDDRENDGFYGPPLQFPDIFRVNSNVPSSLHNSSSREQFYFRLSWLEFRSVDPSSLRELKSIRCDFRHAEYTANVTWNPRGRTFVPNVEDRFYPLYNDDLPLTDTGYGNYSLICLGANCMHYNSIGYIDAFISLLPRNLSTGDTSSSFEVLDHIFRIQRPGSAITSFHLPNLDECYAIWNTRNCPVYIAFENGLETFLNVTGDTIYTPSQDTSVYEYSSDYLWAFYGAALAASTVVSLVAIILAYIHGIPSAIGVSHFLIMT
ncbi:hypothetical protein FRC17_001888 [Serendipita sp. 399]|nr:hypothetical protein FRC17_001888 [Serendipita sp. 399]